MKLPRIDEQGGEALPKSLQDCPKEYEKGTKKLDWWWFDPLQCWNDIHELWAEGELRTNLLHSSGCKVPPTEESGGTFPRERSRKEAKGKRFVPAFQ